MAIWQDLVDSCGFTGGYQSVKRFVRKLRGKHSPEACAVIETAPGEESQVDYGTGPMVRDPLSGKYRRTRLFVLTLGYSRKSVRLLVFRSSSQTWADLHEKALANSGMFPTTPLMRYSSGEWGLVMALARLLSGRSSPQSHWANPMKKRCSGVKPPMGSSFFPAVAVFQAL